LELTYNHSTIGRKIEDIFLREEFTLFSQSNRVHFFNTEVRSGRSNLAGFQELLLPLRCVVEVHPEWYLDFIFARVEFSGEPGQVMVKQIVTEISQPGLKVDTSGHDLEYARWILENTMQGLVPSEHNLLVKVQFPKHWHRLDAKFYVEAKFKRKGWQKLLPVLGSAEVRLADQFSIFGPVSDSA